jgi:threonine-phosphate decarboxylase
VEKEQMTSFHEVDLIPAHGGQLRQIASLFGIPQEDLLDFSANINPNGPPDNVLYALREALLDTNYLREYPESEYRDLKRVFADYTGLFPSTVVVSNGVIALLEAALRATKVTKCFLPVPAFSEYRRALERCAIQVVACPLSAESNFKINPKQILAGMRQHACDALLLANPQNPSGVALEREELRRLLQEITALGAHVFLDEAFIDYLPEKSLTSWTPESSQIICFRSVTKLFALAGMRVAFAVTNGELARQIEKYIPEWPVTTLASMAAQIALSDQAFLHETLHENRKERTWLLEQLQTLDLTIYPGEANFLLFRIPARLRGEVFWQRLIREHHIVVRYCGNFEALHGQFFRTVLRKREENKELMEALQSLL